MTGPELAQALRDLFTAIAKRSRSATVDGWCATGQGLATKVAALGGPPGLAVVGLDLALDVGETLELEANDAGLGAVGWASSNLAVATVAGATLTVRGEGDTTLGASAANGAQGLVMLRVRSRGGVQILPPPPPVVVLPPAATASKLAMVTQPAGAVDGVAFTTQPVVRLQAADSSNVATPGVTVTVSINTGSGTLSGTTSIVTDSSGIATFTNLKIVGDGAHTLAFASASLTGVNSASFTVTTSTKLAMVTQPAGSFTGVAFSTQPAVRLQDASSNNVFRSGISVTVTINTGSGTLSGTTSASTDSSGIATFTNLVITGSGAHTLAFASAGLTGINSASFTVEAADAAWPNQPSGYTVFAERGYNTNTEWGDVSANTRMTIVTDGTAPKSASNVLRVTHPAGMGYPNPPGSGLQDLGSCGFLTLPGSTTRVYLSYWWKNSASFQYPTAGMEKQWYMWSFNLSGGFPDRPHTTLKSNNGGLMTIGFQNMGMDVPGESGGTPGLIARTLTASVSVTDNTWVRTEVVFVANTPGTANGTAQMWINGTLAISATDVGWFESGQSAHFDYLDNVIIWGGNTDTALVSEQYLYFDHAYLSRATG